MTQLPFSLAALMNCFTILFFTFVRQRTQKPQNKIFIGMTLVLALNAVSIAIEGALIPASKTSDSAFFAVKAAIYLYFLLHTALCPAFLLYVMAVTKRMTRLRLSSKFLLALPFIITEVGAVLNPLTHWIYYYDGSRTFTRCWGEWCIYGAAAFYFVISFILLMWSWQAMTRKRREALLYFFAVVLFGIVLQAVFEGIKSELFCESIGMMGIMIAVENEDDRLDALTGLGNRFAFQNDLNTALVSGQQLHLVELRITNADSIQRTTGTDNTKMLMELVAPYLRTKLPSYMIYIINPETLMLTVPDRKGMHAVELAGDIAARFRKPWNWQDTELPLRAVVLCAEVPWHVRSVSEALYMADSTVPENKEGQVLAGRDLSYLLRRAEIEAAVTRGLEQGNYFVCYQPTYHVDGTLHGAEALIRLKDPELGNLFPDEFIPAAERLGAIDDLDCVVLQHVCRLLATGIAEKTGLECINVNLSVLHCMQPDFIKRINDIVEEAGVSKHQINFEITESAAAEDYELLSSIIASLKQEGYQFSMDDFGTGYANMKAIYSFDFDVVKIDKSLLWNAGKNELGQVLLDNSVRMIRQMHRKILVEGVETRAQIELLRTLGVDYLQGYYFSKPIPEADFLALILNEDKEED
ncbi:MAG: EAL domain-containing protein [Oscillospiraceae bacterium]|nr:EAL domain-containing protein [Oscillospiraceae bacterium]